MVINGNQSSIFFLGAGLACGGIFALAVMSAIPIAMIVLGKISMIEKLKILKFESLVLFRDLVKS